MVQNLRLHNLAHRPHQATAKILDLSATFVLGSTVIYWLKSPTSLQLDQPSAGHIDLPFSSCRLSLILPLFFPILLTQTDIYCRWNEDMMPQGKSRVRVKKGGSQYGSEQWLVTNINRMQSMSSEEAEV